MVHSTPLLVLGCVAGEEVGAEDSDIAGALLGGGGLLGAGGLFGGPPLFLGAKAGVGESLSPGLGTRAGRASSPNSGEASVSVFSLKAAKASSLLKSVLASAGDMDWLLKGSSEAEFLPFMCTGDMM